MKSEYFESPTIILITDHLDLDDQLSNNLSKPKLLLEIIRWKVWKAVPTWKEKLQDRQSGGVFLTTIHKFTEDTDLLTERSNVICISDEAHRSQINLDQKIKSPIRVWKPLALPNTSTILYPIPHSWAYRNTDWCHVRCFGNVVDKLTMTESVRDKITVKLFHEGKGSKGSFEQTNWKNRTLLWRSCRTWRQRIPDWKESNRKLQIMYAILGRFELFAGCSRRILCSITKRISEGQP